MDSDLIKVFRVMVSGEAATFDSIDSAVAYLRSQAHHNNIGQIIIESAQISIAEYRAEVERQEVAP